MDWDLSFTPIDEDTLSKKALQHADVRNSKIELIARIGKGVASVPLPVVVTEVEFKGKARIQLKFMTAYPHIKTVDFCFLEKPLIDFVVRPLKGMDLMDVSYRILYIRRQKYKSCSCLYLDSWPEQIYRGYH